jgi:fructose-specific phosphotransferase system component IIB
MLYVNDLPLNIQDAKLVLFAADINILIIDKNIDAIQVRLNRVMKQFETWFSNNSLIINTDKTKAMLFHFNKTCNII